MTVKRIVSACWSGHDAVPKLIAVVAILLLVFSGCKGLGGGGNGGTITTPESVRKGTDGLSVEFVKNTPPSEIFDDSYFTIALVLENKGAADIKEGMLTLGIEEDYFDLEGKAKSDFINLKGKTVSNPIGDQITVTYKVKARKLPPQTEVYTALVAATACYEYDTLASFDICIDPYLYGSTTPVKKACEIKELTSSGQGGPVAVTKVETFMLPHEKDDYIQPEFVITISNMRDGILFKKGNVEQMCTGSGVSKGIINNADVSVFLANTELKCDPTELNFEEKEEKIRCSMDEGIAKELGSFTSPLQVMVSYGYSNTISEEVKIKKII